MAKISCPVALCGWEGHPNHFYKHVKEYEKKYEGQILQEGSALWKSHDRFASYFFRDIWESKLPEELKWRKIAFAYIKQEKDLKKELKDMKSGNPLMSPQSIEVKDGKYLVDGKEYTQQEFMNMQKGIRYVPVETRK